MPGLRSDRLSPVKGTGRWRGPEGAGCCFPFGNLTALSGARPELFSSLFLHRKRRNALADHPTQSPWAFIFTGCPEPIRPDELEDLPSFNWRYGPCFFFCNAGAGWCCSSAQSPSFFRSRRAARNVHGEQGHHLLAGSKGLSRSMALSRSAAS